MASFWLHHLLINNSELQSTVASRQKLEGQKQENVGVQQVFTPFTSE